MSVRRLPARILKNRMANLANFCFMLPMAMAHSNSDGILIRYVLRVLLMTSMFSYHGTNGRTGMAFCSLPCGGADGHGHWLGRQAC